MWRLLSQLECLFASGEDSENFGGGGGGYTSTLSFLAAACATIRATAGSQ